MAGRFATSHCASVNARSLRGAPMTGANAACNFARELNASDACDSMRKKRFMICYFFLDTYFAEIYTFVNCSTSAAGKTHIEKGE